MLRSHSKSDMIFFPAQLCCTSSCADVEKARKVEARLEFYKVYTIEGERVRALRIFAREKI